MNNNAKIKELIKLESLMQDVDFRSPEDVEQFFVAYTKIIWDHWMIGRIYDHYEDDTVIHGENGIDICGIRPVIAHTSERLQSMPDFSINFIGIWAQKISEREYRFIQITYPEGTFTGPSIYGPPTQKKLHYDNIMNMCECLVKKIDGVWKIVEEWGLLGYAGFFSEGAKEQAE
jgi:hypothetical protein